MPLTKTFDVCVRLHAISNSLGISAKDFTHTVQAHERCEAVQMVQSLYPQGRIVACVQATA